MDKKRDALDIESTPEGLKILSQILDPLIGVTTAEDALRISLEMIRNYSFRPSRDHEEFKSLFPRGREIDDIFADAVLTFSPANSDAQDGGSVSQIFPDHALPQTAEPQNPLAKLLGQTSLSTEGFEAKSRLDERTADITRYAVGKIIEWAYKNENERIQAYNDLLIEVVQRESNGGEFIVIHAGRQMLDNGLHEILLQTGVFSHHRQPGEFDRENFFMIHLETWVDFCQLHFPRKMAERTKKREDGEAPGNEQK